MYFQFNSHIHDYNTRSTNNLHPAIFRTNFSQFSVRFQGRSYPCIFDTPAQQCIIFSSDGSCYFNCLSLYSDGLYFYLSFVHSSCTFPSEVCLFFHFPVIIYCMYSVSFYWSVVLFYAQIDFNNTARSVLCLLLLYVFGASRL